MKIIRIMKKIFSPPHLTKGDVGFTIGAFIPNGDADKALKSNEIQILRATLALQKEAQQKQLYFMWASFMVSILASIIATAALIVAILQSD